MTGKIIRIETFWKIENSYVEYMWIRIYIEKSFNPLITPFFEFMDVFLGDSNELEKLIGSEIEWTYTNTKSSKFKILNEQLNNFIYASISKIIYSNDYSKKPFFDFKRIVIPENKRYFTNKKKLIIDVENEIIVYKEFQRPFDVFSYSKGNFLLIKRNEQTLELEIITFRHCRAFYDENRFFNTYKDKEEFLKLLELYKSYTQINRFEQSEYSNDDMINDAFEGDSSNLWNID